MVRGLAFGGAWGGFRFSKRGLPRSPAGASSLATYGFIRRRLVGFRCILRLQVASEMMKSITLRGT